MPQITSVRTYQQGVFVYVDIEYADPGHDAQGFGFMGVSDGQWVEETYPLSGPDNGIIGPDSIAYPLDLACGTPLQHQAEIEVWIYDTAAGRSQPAAAHLACTDPAGSGNSAGSVNLAAGQWPSRAAEPGNAATNTASTLSTTYTA